LQNFEIIKLIPFIGDLMRFILVAAVALLISNTSFAESLVQCQMTASAADGSNAVNIKTPALTTGKGPRLQEIGKYNGLTFSLAYHDSGAAGPFNMVGIEWTDGTNTYLTKQIYGPGIPIRLFVDIKGQAGVIYLGCGGQPPSR
jgi:hypothetical protein